VGKLLSHSELKIRLGGLSFLVALFEYWKGIRKYEIISAKDVYAAVSSLINAGVGENNSCEHALEALLQMVGNCFLFFKDTSA
jgi:hypothetical protein